MRCTLCGLHNHVRDDHMVLTNPGQGIPLSNVDRALAKVLGVVTSPGVGSGGASV